MILSKYFQNLDLKNLNVEFCDVRIEWNRSTSIRYIDGDLNACVERPSLGAFIRIFNKGRWNFLSTTHLQNLNNIIKQFAIDCRTKPQGPSVFKPPVEVNSFHGMCSVEQDFYALSLSEKKSNLSSYLELTQSIPNLKNQRVIYSDHQKRKAYISSVGTSFEFDFSQGGVFIEITIGNGQNNFEDYLGISSDQFGQLKNRQIDFINYFQESQKFINASAVTPGKYRVVFCPDVTGTFTHELFGHKSEADFMLGDPEAIKLWKIGKIVAPDHLSIVDSGLHFGTSGYSPIDDEGQLATKTYLIKNGILTGRLHSSETSQVLNENMTGNARAKDFEYEPIVRMTSTYIENGETSFSELLKKCDDGLYFKGYRHGSGGSTFTIAPVRTYEIKNGVLGKPLRASAISGSLFKTMECIEAVGNNFKLVSSAFGGCGKMEQWPLSVASGGPSILVSEMQVG